MHTILNRILSLILCAGLLCGILPGVNAFATETESIMSEAPAETSEVIVETEIISEDTIVIPDVTEEAVTVTEDETEPVETEYTGSVSDEAVASIEQFAEYTYGFTTFADLKELAARSYSDYTFIYYTGTEPLVISESLTLPEMISLGVYDAPMTISPGVTLTVSGNLSADDLTVNGTLVVQYCGIYVNQTLTVNGTILLDGEITVSGDTEIIGIENIVFGSEWGAIVENVDVTTTAELYNTITAASEQTNPHWNYNVYIPGEQDFHLLKSTTVPGNIRLTLGGYGEMPNTGTFIIPEGCTLTLNSNTFVNMTMDVQGTLAYEALLDVAYDQGGTIRFGSTGSLTGGGMLQVYSMTLTSVDPALPGLDLSKYYFETVTYEPYTYWMLIQTDGLTQLGAPSELKWGIEYVYEWNEVTETVDLVAKEHPGFISWKTARPDQSMAMIHFYRVGETYPCFSGGWSFGDNIDEIPQWRSIDDFCLADPESGTYYFTVTSQGDNTSYYNSETVVSNTWTYTKPSAQVAPCENAKWNWPEFRWEPPANDPNLGGYETRVYFAASESDTPELRYSSRWWEPSACVDALLDDVIQGCGTGYYYFQVRALSNDITVACNSEWSEMSEPYNLTELTQRVETELENIVANIPGSDSITEEDQALIRETVQALDTEELKTSMLADQSNTGAVEYIAALEEAVGGAAPITVSEEASAFTVEDISIIGANLNNSASAEDPITLVIDKPEKENIIPEAYDNSVAVSFSMILDNVEDPKNLEVPVKITLPVPATINPAFLVVLHYHADGSVEELRPHIYREDGKYFASFVLTSFSDFIMTQALEPDVLLGDANGDGLIDFSDAVLVLEYSAFLIDDSQITLSASDVNGDGFVDFSDAVLILEYSAFLIDKFPAAK